MNISTQQQPKRRCIKIAALGVILFAVLSACAHVAPSKTTVTLTFACSSLERDDFELAAQKFHDENPDIVIKVVASSGFFSGPPADPLDTTAWLEHIATHADVFTWQAGITEPQTEALHNLTSFLAGSADWGREAFSSEMLLPFTFQGDVWGIPYGVDPVLVIYDPETFAAAHLEQPGYDWSWEDFIAVAHKLSLRQGQTVSRYGFADFELLGVPAAVLAATSRHTTAQSALLALDDPVIVAAAQRYVALSLNDRIWLGVSPTQDMRAIDRVQQGAAAMGLIHSTTWLAAEPESVAHLGALPLPDNSAVSMTGLFMSRGTPHAAAAWRWMAYLSQRVPPSKTLPARRALLSTATLLEQAPPAFTAAALYAIEHYQAPLYPLKTTRRLQQAIEQALSGKDVAQALAEAQAYLEQPQVAAEKTRFTIPTPVMTPDVDVLKDRELITFMTYEKWLYAPLAEAFHAEQSQIGVIIETPPVPEDSAESFNLSLQLQSLSKGDCFLSMIHPHFRFVRERILNMQPLADADPAFPWEDYTAQALSVAVYDGELWGLPAGLKPQVLWYNPTHFAQAGLAPPQSNWTWDTVWQAAQALSGGEGAEKRYGLALWPYNPLWQLFERAAGPLWAAGAPPQTPQFATPEMRAAAAQVARLVDQAVIPNAAHPDAQQRIRRLVAGNRVAMWPMGARTCEFGAGQHFPDAGTDCLPAPLPQSRAGSSDSSPQIYYISAGTSHAEACWQWLRFLSDRVPPHLYVPPRLSLISSTTFGELVDLEAQTVYLDASRQALPMVLHDIDADRDPAFRALTWLEEALVQIVWHGGDVNTHLSLAAQRAETYVTCLRRCPDLYAQECAAACLAQAGAANP